MISFTATVHGLHHEPASEEFLPDKVLVEIMSAREASGERAIALSFREDAPAQFQVGDPVTITIGPGV